MESPGPTRFADSELVRDPQTLRRFARSGLSAREIELRGVLFPTSAQELSQALREASLRGIAVYPVSQGKNWGYGSAVPVVPGCLVISLERMNRVLAIDAQLARVEIEPGVTQGQLHAALEGTGLLADANGSGPDTSIIGNVLERGFGHTPLGWRSRHFQVTEFLLGDGRIVRPAGGGELAFAERVGLGAGLHELLTQNNAAVVTRMRIDLMRRPERSYCCVLKLEHAEQIGAYVDAMHELKEEGVFDGLPHIGNDYRLLTGMARFDFGSWDPERGVPEAERAALRRAHGVAPWTLVAGIYGTAQSGPAKVRRARRRLAPLGSLAIYRQDRTQRMARALLAAAARLPRALSERLRGPRRALEQRLGVLRVVDGEPSAVALAGCYWRQRRVALAPGADPVADGCGLRWLSPVLPLLRAPVQEFLALCERRYAERGFEFACTLTAVSSRSCTAVLSIFFDLDSPRECERASELARELKREFDRRGWPSYRLATDQMQEEIAAAPAELVALRERIKRAFDPAGVIAPGRYSARPQPAAELPLGEATASGAALEALLRHAQLEQADAVFDAWPGRGELLLALARHCRARGWALPALHARAPSVAQLELLRAQLGELKAQLTCGEDEPPAAAFDRVLVGGGLHGLDGEARRALIAAAFRALRPGGMLLCLVVAWDDEEQAREFGELERARAALLGEPQTQCSFAARQVVRLELLSAGFADVAAVERFEGAIESQALRRALGARPDAERALLRFQGAQAQAGALRRAGRLRFEGAESALSVSAEITIARRSGGTAAD